MILRSEFPDAEALVITFIREELGGAVPVSNEQPESWDLIPDSVADDVPWVVVERIPGGGVGEEYESTPTLEITLFHRDRVLLTDELIRPLERILPGLPQKRPIVDSLSMPQTFGVVQYANRSVRKGVGRVQLVTRPVR